MSIFAPLTCLAGANGVGKSNIFDAVRFLSLLTDHTLMDAALTVRGTDEATSDPRELFWTDGRDQIEEMRLAVEMIVDHEVHDDFGRRAEARSTFLRYEIRLGYEPPEHRGHLGRLVLRSESLDYIPIGDAVHRLRFSHNAGKFRQKVVHNQRRGAGYISTKIVDGITEILVHQDGGSSGNPRAHATTAPRTIVGTSNTAATPTILAARREMQQWRLLALEPSAMRSADRFAADPHMGSDGSHIPATLYRLATEAERNGGKDRLYARIADRLATLVPIRDLKVQVDEVRQILTLEAEELSGIRLPARSLSDGTLRFLTLCVLKEDPSLSGLICMEEPENGIHPAKMEAMADLLRDLPVDPNEAPGVENPFRQLIVATHSPPFVQLQDRDSLLFANEVRIRGPFGRPTSTLRCEPLAESWRTKNPSERNGIDRGIGMMTILAYLTAPPGAQIRLPFDVV